MINAIRWVLRMGSPWRALPAHFGSWKTVSSRFYRGTRAGVWGRVLAELQRQADTKGRLDRSLHFVDSTVVRAHQHTAGAKGGAGGQGTGTQPGRLLHQDSPVGRAGRG